MGRAAVRRLSGLRYGTHVLHARVKCAVTRGSIQYCASGTAPWREFDVRCFRTGNTCGVWSQLVSLEIVSVSGRAAWHVEANSDTWLMWQSENDERVIYEGLNRISETSQLNRHSITPPGVESLIATEVIFRGLLRGISSLLVELVLRGTFI